METYTGLTGGTFKTRYNKHMYDFRTVSQAGATTLSKHIWKLKRENAPYNLAWEVLARAKVFNPVTRTCQLCLREKYLISFYPESATLNSRTELYSTCRHRLKMLLENFKTWTYLFFFLFFLSGSENVICILCYCHYLSYNCWWVWNLFIRNKFVQKYMVKVTLELLI